jgi:hypothetical protein
MSKSSIMFDTSIYITVEINSSWKRDSLQMMIFVNVWWIWSMVELKTRFKTWITRNDVNCLFHLFYLINLLFTCVHNGHQTSKSSIYVWFVLNRGWKRDPLQIMIFVCFLDMKHSRNKTRFETWITWNDVNSVRCFHLS